MRVCAERNVILLKELRYVSGELGYEEARRLPREIRHWWIGEISGEREKRNEEIARANAGTRAVDVPRAPRG